MGEERHAQVISGWLAERRRKGEGMADPGDIGGDGKAMFVVLV